ncbi:hypothetical protein [Tenacibaculum sp. M341]|uniref:hypothetical protein n=1 Tax=Tenacibaculum sp. M341 TaxID=2530339 RepID=UPI001047F329|nr:hypothetical protein [Tenacibaculum sp. M341]TCI91334.1 hypothetical protein EYW44_10280 [Tenacibaculum sp. M341]
MVNQERLMTIESDRDSVCAGDDMSRHNVFSEFSEDTTIENMMTELMKIHTIGSTWAVWAGTYTNYKCIRDRKGNWLIDEKTRIKDFFQDIEKFVFFDKEFMGSIRCEK